VLYRLTFRTNPRMLLLPVVLVGLIALGALAWRYAGAVVGIVVLAIGVYLDVQIVRFLAKHLGSWVRTTDQGLSCRLPDGSTLHFDWKNLTRGGICRGSGSRPFLFLYDEKQDRLLSIPNEYNHFAELEEEIRALVPKGTAFEEVRLGRGEMIEDWLKQKIG
jgi:hypothetical protein